MDNISHNNNKNKNKIINYSIMFMKGEWMEGFFLFVSGMIIGGIITTVIMCSLQINRINGK